MILQVRTPSRASKEKILRVSCRSSEGFRDPATRRNAWCGLGFAGGFLGIAGFETARNEIGWNEKLKAKTIARNIIFQSFMNLDSMLIFQGALHFRKNKSPGGSSSPRLTRVFRSFAGFGGKVSKLHMGGWWAPTSKVMFDLSAAKFPGKLRLLNSCVWV